MWQYGSVESWAHPAAMISGCACPMMETAAPPQASRMVWPVERVRVLPWAETAVGGGELMRRWRSAGEEEGAAGEAFLVGGVEGKVLAVVASWASSAVRAWGAMSGVRDSPFSGRCLSPCSGDRTSKEAPSGVRFERKRDGVMVQFLDE